MYENSSMSKTEFQALEDKMSTGKVRPWKEKKQNSLEVSGAYYDADLKNKSERMASCADVLEFKKTSKGLRLANTWFCKVRLCPMCNWRRSLKLATQNKQIVQEANKREKLRWIFLTLTGGKTVEGQALKERVEHMSKSFNRLMKYKTITNVCRGFFRGLEVTKTKGKYHPHFHVLIAVKPSFFKDKYIKQSEWMSLWQKALKTTDKVIVDVRVVKPNEKHKKLSDDEIKAMEGALHEVSKYAVKDTDLLKGDRQENAMTVYTVDQAISHKRLIGYGGLLKEIRNELQLGDPEEEAANLIQIDEECEDQVANEVEHVMAYWHYGIKNYVLKD